MGALLVRVVTGIARVWAEVRDATRQFLTPSYRFALPDPQLERWARARTVATVAPLVVVHLVWGDVVDWVSRGIDDYVAGVVLAVVLGWLALLIASGIVVAVAHSGRRRRQTAHLGLPLSRLAGVWGGLVVVLGLTGLTRLVGRGMGAGPGLAGVLAVLAGLAVVAVAAIALLAFVVTAATAITRHCYRAVGPPAGARGAGLRRRPAGGGRAGRRGAAPPARPRPPAAVRARPLTGVSGPRRRAAARTPAAGRAR